MNNFCQSYVKSQRKAITGHHYIMPHTLKIILVMYQTNRSFNIPSRGNPWAFKFLENFCSNPLLPWPKSCSNPPTHICLRGRSRWGRNLFLWIHKSLTPSSLSWFINPRGISVTRNMISRLGSNSPSPMSGDQIPSLPGRKRRQNARGMPGGRMLKLWFDWYIIVFLHVITFDVMLFL